jgi:predicted anti-sigma-YlaC factor YlaD
VSTVPAPLACARVRVLIEPYVDGSLAAKDPQGAAQLRVHLANCEDCRRQHQQAVSIPFRLKALRAPEPPASLVADVMASVAPGRHSSRRAWGLLVPEALLIAFIVWSLSGLDGLASLAGVTVTDLQELAGWGTGSAALPSVPVADILLLGALIALTAIAAYHVSVLAQLSGSVTPPAVRQAGEEYSRA